MDLQTAPSLSRHAPLSTGALGPSGPARQRASQDVQTAAGSEFAAAMQSALGSISATLQEVKTVLSATPQAQQPALAEVFKGFGVLVDQLAQVYGGTGSAQTTSSTTGLADRSTLPLGMTDTGGGAAATGAATTSGAPVTWESYSSSAAYQGAKADYLGRMQRSNPTDQWVIAALNKAIEQNVANGYDPEKSHTVNTLRGYFSGDAQARSRAIHSLDSNMLKAGGAYETVDYGLHIIAGAPPEGMNTSMPTFKSAYDKDWDRPSLYDMINSSLGWSEKANLYADPASRDAALNRKLSDAEITAFQSGTLTPDLQALVAKYRGA